jgi:hypothetical protein
MYGYCLFYLVYDVNLGKHPFTGYTKFLNIPLSKIGLVIGLDLMKGKEMKGKEMKGKERKGKERKGKHCLLMHNTDHYGHVLYIDYAIIANKKH